MPRGGHRENAGRKRGTPNKASAARQAEVAASGVTPLEVMLDNMRFAHERAAEVLAKVLAGDQADEAETLNTFKELLRLRQVAEECAKDAAPYVHPRLSAVRHSGPDGEGPVTLLALLQEIDGTTRGPPNAAKTI